MAFMIPPKLTPLYVITNAFQAAKQSNVKNAASKSSNITPKPLRNFLS
jgi:hypothetical protein